MQQKGGRNPIVFLRVIGMRPPQEKFDRISTAIRPRTSSKDGGRISAEIRSGLAALAACVQSDFNRHMAVEIRSGLSGKIPVKSRSGFCGTIPVEIRSGLSGIFPSAALMLLNSRLSQQYQVHSESQLYTTYFNSYFKLLQNNYVRICLRAINKFVTYFYTRFLKEKLYYMLTVQ